MMILPHKKDAIHKAWLYRLLEAIADDAVLASVFWFKGGTCASMLNWLDRFSVDLDFDYSGTVADVQKTRHALENLAGALGLTVKDSSKKGIQYFFRYESKGSERNTIKIDAAFPIFSASKYQPQRFVEIDRIITCQTKETMVAHKLVALIDRFEKTGHIAGRDVYDIHQFLMNGFGYEQDVIEERRHTSAKHFFKQLESFVDRKVTDTIITEDLSTLLPLKVFTRIRKILKRELITLLRDELQRLK